MIGFSFCFCFRLRQSGFRQITRAKRRSHKRNRKKMETFWFFQLRHSYDSAYDSALFIFISHKRCYGSAYDSDSVTGKNQTLNATYLMFSEGDFSLKNTREHFKVVQVLIAMFSKFVFFSRFVFYFNLRLNNSTTATLGTDVSGRCG